MLRRFIPLSALAVALFSLSAQANEKINTAIADKLSQYDITVEEIQPTPVSGIFEVQTQSGILYTTHDASHFFYGKLFATEKNILIDLTQKTEAKRNLAFLKKAEVEKELISFPAKKEKYAITVFTDTTCGYCVKLHEQMPKYNELGITVHYLAFPRGGERASNLGQMSAIWCAKDKNEAMDLAKTGQFKQNDTICMNIVRKHYELGTQIGISGTPAIMLQDGSMISGYLPPEQLIQRLKQQG